MSTSPLPAWLEPLGHGVHAIDTGFLRPRFDAAYLIVQDGRAAFVDNGTKDALPRLLGALDVLGVARDAVDHVIVTHVHLDHAGATGLLMRELPRATLVVHPRGARHLNARTGRFRGANSGARPLFGKAPTCADKISLQQRDGALPIVAVSAAASMLRPPPQRP